MDDIRQERPYQILRDLQALIVGNPTAPNPTNSILADFDPLPGAEEEARVIHGLFPATKSSLLIGQMATLENFWSKVPSSTLIHLASHALAFSERPLESFVMLAVADGSDGRLTAKQVYDLEDSFNADLVTLSACQTGLGHLSGDGVIGLSRSFLATTVLDVLKTPAWGVNGQERELGRQNQVQLSC